MAVKIGNKNIDEKYSKIVEPNLYAKSIFQPNITYTDKYQEDGAGVVYVHKLGGKIITPSKPGSDYVHTDTSDELLSIAINNEFKHSEKIYNVVAKQVGYDVAISVLEDTVLACKEGREVSGLACLGQEGTTVTGEAVTADTVKSDVVNLRKELAKNKFTPTTLLCSPDAYSAILITAGKDFIPNTNETVVSTGRVGKWLGFDVIECPLLSTASASYYDNTGSLKTVTLSDIDMIAYDYNAFSILDTLTNERIVDSVDFNGVLAQVNIVSGYRVTNAKGVIVRKKSM